MVCVLCLHLYTVSENEAQLISVEVSTYIFPLRIKLRVFLHLIIIRKVIVSKLDILERNDAKFFHYS